MSAMDAKRGDSFPLRRRDVVDTLLADRGDLLVVAGLGACAWDITAAGDHDCNFPLWGAMGGAVMIGLGIAQAQPDRPVLVLTGDGEMLMGVGSIATVAVKRPKNLSIVVLDNERFGETGMQTTHTAAGADLAAAAAGLGIETVSTVWDEAGVGAVRNRIHSGQGPSFDVIKIRAEAHDFSLPPKDGAYLKDRFRVAVLGKDAATL